MEINPSLNKNSVSLGAKQMQMATSCVKTMIVNIELFLQMSGITKLPKLFIDVF